MQLSPTRNSATAAIREAAEWLLRMREKPLTANELDDFEHWRTQSQEHVQAWRKAESLSHKLQSIPSRLGMAVLDRPQSADRREFIKLLSVLMVAVPTGTLAYKQLPWGSWVADHQTAIGEQRTLTLADGSKLHINTDSAVDVDFNPHQRLVTLHRGEIYLESGHDALARPLWVQTSHGRLVALGTKFIVRTEKNRSYLGVTEGAVDAIPKENIHQNLIVHAGHEVTFNAYQMSDAALLNDNASAWVEGAIYADHMPIEQFIEEIGRYRKGILQCDPSVAGIKVSGAFQLNDPDRILDALQKTRPVRVVWRTRYWGVVHSTT